MSEPGPAPTRAPGSGEAPPPPGRTSRAPTPDSATAPRTRTAPGPLHTPPAQALGATLRAWRDRLAPADVGLPSGRARRARGLRREELAELSGISVDYVVRLEQGRFLTPSGQVVAALGRALQLTGAERDHLYRLAGLAPPSRAEISDRVPAGLARMVDRLGDAAVAIFAADWQLIRWNAAWAALIGDPTSTPADLRNFARDTFPADAGTNPLGGGTGGAADPAVGGTGGPGVGSAGGPPSGDSGGPPVGGAGGCPMGDPGKPSVSGTSRPPAGDPGKPPTGGTDRPPAGRPPAGGTDRPPAGDPGKPPTGGADGLSMDGPGRPPVVSAAPPRVGVSGADGIGLARRRVISLTGGSVEAAVVSDLRRATGRFPHSRRLAALVESLRAGNARFAALWADGVVAAHREEHKIIEHPDGPITVDCDVVTDGDAELKIVILTAEPGSPDEARLRQLTGAAQV